MENHTYTKKAPPAGEAAKSGSYISKNSLNEAPKSSNDFLSAALEHASSHRAVFPLGEQSKVPLTSKREGGNGYKDATTDLDQITLWWTQEPNSNIGIATGKKSGLIVLDVDTRHGGHDSLHDLQIEHDDLPETFTVQTSDGGRHFYFQYPNFKNNKSFVPSKTIAPGVEVKSAGAYVVAAPSVHPSGHIYKIISGESPAPCPKWIIDLVLAAKRERKGKGALPKIIKAGEQHDWLVSQAGRLRCAGLDGGEILEALLAINENRCVPPKEVEAVEKIAKSAGEWEQGNSLNVDSLRVEEKTNVSSDVEGETLSESKSEAAARYPQTDLGNSRRFSDHHRGKIRFCPSVGWLIWNGVLWRPDEIKKVEQLARETTKAMLDEISSLPEQDQSAAFKWAKQTQHKTRFQAMIDLARSEIGVPVVTEELDKVPNVLPVKNGWVDLLTGTLSAPRKEEILTLGSAVEIYRDAVCPKWERFISQVTGGDQELATYLRTACGYASAGDPKERAIFLILGSGMNGKSVFLETISRILGTLACKTPIESLLIKQGSQIPADIARLRAKRFVYASEAPPERAFNSALCKEISGRETLTARHLYKEYFEFTPRFVLFLGTNHLPRVDASDQAMWDRLKVIPFKQRFEGCSENKNLLNELWEERQGILNWIVRGAVDWNHQGLPGCKAVESEALIYRQGEDTVERFFNACVIMSPSSEVETMVLFESYKKWCSEQGLRASKQKDFNYKILDRSGIEKARNTPGRMIFRGVELA